MIERITHVFLMIYLTDSVSYYYNIANALMLPSSSTEPTPAMLATTTSQQQQSTCIGAKGQPAERSVDMHMAQMELTALLPEPLGMAREPALLPEPSQLPLFLVFVSSYSSHAFSQFDVLPTA